jgi:hypothetical protein
MNAKVMTGLLLLLALSAYGQEVDATAQMNSALLGKQQVAYYVCHAPANNSPLCNGKGFVLQGTQPGAAAVKSSFVVEVKSLTFGTPIISSLPEIALLSSKTILNCGDVSVTSSDAISVAGTKLWSTAKTAGVTTSTGGSVSGSFSYDGGTLSTSLKWDSSFSTSTTQTDGESTTVTRTRSDQFSVAQNKAVEISLLAFQVTVKVPFSTTVVVDGDLFDNLSGKFKASSLLSVDERTFPLKGTLTITDVSKDLIKTKNLAGVCNGSAPLKMPGGGQISKPVSELPKGLLKEFGLPEPQANKK